MRGVKIRKEEIGEVRLKYNTISNIIIVALSRRVSRMGREGSGRDEEVCMGGQEEGRAYVWGVRKR